MPPVSSPEPETFVCQGVHDPFLLKKKSSGAKSRTRNFSENTKLSNGKILLGTLGGSLLFFHMNV